MKPLFLHSQDIEVLAIEGLGYGENGPSEVSAYPSRMPESIRLSNSRASVDRPEAQAVVISCTDFPTFSIIRELEDKLGKPVVTSNQATSVGGLASRREFPTACLASASFCGLIEKINHGRI